MTLVLCKCPCITIMVLFLIGILYIPFTLKVLLLDISIFIILLPRVQLLTINGYY